MTDQTPDAVVERCGLALGDLPCILDRRRTKDILSALTPGDQLPGGNVVVPKRLLALAEIIVMPWGAGKAAILEDLTGDNLSGFDAERELLAMIEASHGRAALENEDG